VCQMTISHNKFSWSKGPFSNVWTTFSNVYSLTSWPCLYKGSFPLHTIVKDIHFYAPYIQIVIINIQWVKEHGNFFTYIELGHSDMWKFCKNVKNVLENTLGMTQEDHLKRKFMSSLICKSLKNVTPNLTLQNNPHWKFNIYL
jgi:hypothetical protein